MHWQQRCQSKQDSYNTATMKIPHPETPKATKGTVVLMAQGLPQLMEPSRTSMSAIMDTIRNTAPRMEPMADAKIPKRKNL